MIDNEVMEEAYGKINTKSFLNTFIYTKLGDNGESSEQDLLFFIKSGTRINKNSKAFEQIKADVKVRQTTAVLYRVLMLDSVELVMANKELPSSFKVFYDRDIKYPDKKANRVFIDVTGLIRYNNGMFYCKEIDKFCAYLMGALVLLTYYNDPGRLITNANIVRYSAQCYTKLFTGVLDSLRVSNYTDNKLKISFIVIIFFLYNLVGKDLESSEKLAANILSINPRDASAYTYYYDATDDMVNIDVFIRFLAEMFKMNGLTTDVFINRWIMMYGKGTMYGCELFPMFLIMMTNTYSGAYVNGSGQKTIENYCSREMVTLATTLLRAGADLYDKGFHYESALRDDLDSKK